MVSLLVSTPANQVIEWMASGEKGYSINILKNIGEQTRDCSSTDEEITPVD